MTEYEIIEMAKEAFIKRGFWPNEVMWKCWLDAWILSAQLEREACANIADNHIDGTPDWNSAANNIAQAIRARGKT